MIVERRDDYDEPLVAMSISCGVEAPVRLHRHIFANLQEWPAYR